MHWEHEVLVTGLPGKSQHSSFFFTWSTQDTGLCAHEYSNCTQARVTQCQQYMQVINPGPIVPKFET